MHISGAPRVKSKPRGPAVCARSGPCVREGLGRSAGFAGTRVCVRECALTRSKRVSVRSRAPSRAPEPSRRVGEREQASAGGRWGCQILRAELFSPPAPAPLNPAAT